MASHSLGAWAHPRGGVSIPRAVKENKPQNTSTFQALVCIMLVNAIHSLCHCAEALPEVVGREGGIFHIQFCQLLPWDFIIAS